MTTYLTKIKFTSGREGYGYQETETGNGKTLLHLYDENGDQIDGGNGYFPNAEWEALPHRPTILEDTEDFWNAIESDRHKTETESN